MNYLVGRDPDMLIARYVIRSGKLNMTRFMNMLLITFKPLEGFTFKLWKRYMRLFYTYYQEIKPSSPVSPWSHIRLTKRKIPIKITSNDFWRSLLNDLETKDVIVIPPIHNGNIRKRVYMLSALFGFYHITGKQIRCEHRSNHRYAISADREFSKFIKLHPKAPMKLIKKYHLDCSYNQKSLWSATAETNDKGEILYIPNGSFDLAGLMFNGHAEIKLFFIGNIDRSRVRRELEL